MWPMSSKQYDRIIIKLIICKNKLNKSKFNNFIDKTFRLKMFNLHPCVSVNNIPT